jgi:hypothetical protein
MIPGVLLLLFTLPIAAGTNHAPQSGSADVPVTGQQTRAGNRNDPLFAGADPNRRAFDSPVPPDFGAAAGGMRLAAVIPTVQYDEQCSQCHGDVAELVSGSLEFRKGVLTGKLSEKPVIDFLNSHRGLKPAEAEFFSDLLQSVANKLGL